VQAALFAKRAERWNEPALHRVLERVGARSVSYNDDYRHAFIWRASCGDIHFPARGA
jgi:hypothetical protein